MLKGNLRLLNAIDNIKDKGEPVIVAGVTGSGKSSLISYLADDDFVRFVLSFRCSLETIHCNTDIIITDNNIIPKGELIIKAESPKKLINKYFNYACIAELIYDSIKSSERDINWYSDILYRKLDDKITECNQVISVKPQKTAQQAKEAIRELFNALDHVSMMESYYQDDTCISHKLIGFSEIHKKEFKKIEKDINDILYNIIKSGFEYYDNDITYMGIKDDCYYFAIKKANPFPAKELFGITNTRLFQNITLIFRKDNLTNTDLTPDPLKVEENNKEAHYLHLIDTQGFFHTPTQLPDDEASAFIDLLKTYHSNKIIFVINANESNITKRSIDVIAKIINRSKMNLYICFLVTHMDEYIRKMAHQALLEYPVKEIDLSSIIDTSIEHFNKEIENLISNATKKSNIWKDKIACENNPLIAASFAIDKTSAMDMELQNQEFTYDNAVSAIIERLSKYIWYDKRHHRIEIKSSEIDLLKRKELCKDFSSSQRDTWKQECKSILSEINKCADTKNMYGEKKDLHYLTVDACIRYWKEPSSYKTDLKKYASISTKFIDDIMKLVENNVEKCIKKELIDSISNDLYFHNMLMYDYHFINTIAKKTVILMEAAAEDYARKNTAHVYHDKHKIFMLMLDYIRKNFVDIDMINQDYIFDKWRHTLNKAIFESLEEYIDEYHNVV